jgi:chromosome partitioning protein
MPTIVFACGKGGVGKSTSAVILGTELAKLGPNVTVIDADPNKPVSRWSKRGGLPQTLTVNAEATEDTIIDTIEAEALKSTFVIVDLEGTASMTVAYAMSRADLVIIPIQGSFLDAAEASKAVALVRQQERAFSRKIPFAILLTRTSATIRPRTLQSIIGELAQKNLPVFETQVHERDAYKAIFAFGGMLSDLDAGQVPNIPTAVTNARAFAAEVLAMLKQSAPAKQRAAVA